MLKTRKHVKFSTADIDFINELAIRSKEGDQDCFNQLSIIYDPVVYKLARRFGYNSKNTEDYVQEGRIGLYYAIKNFDINKGNNFKIYSLFWIKQAISRAYEKYTNKITIPVRKNQMLRKIRSQDNNTELSKEEQKLLSYDYSYLSIEREYCYNSDNDSYFDRVKDDDIGIDEKVIQEEMIETMYKLIEDLPEREQKIVNYRFGLNGCPRLTLREIGDIYRLTSESIRKIEKKVLEKLRIRFEVQIEL